jgi:hypothetical protein
MNLQIVLRRLILLGTPFTLGLLELWHPVPTPGARYETIARYNDWWLILHMLQLPLFGLMALAVVVLVAGIGSRSTTIAGVGMCFFAVFYTAFDAITGVASGILVRSAQGLAPEQQALVARQIESFFPSAGSDPAIIVIAALGVLGWVVGVIAAAVALARAGAPLPAAILLGLAVIFAMHAPPTGPLGLACFFLAASWIEIARRRLARDEPPWSRATR